MTEQQTQRPCLRRRRRLSRSDLDKARDCGWGVTGHTQVNAAHQGLKSANIWTDGVENLGQTRTRGDNRHRCTEDDLPVQTGRRIDLHQLTRIEVLNGPNTATFSVPTALLEIESELPLSMRKDGWVIVRNVDVRLVACFVHWLLFREWRLEFCETSCSDTTFDVCDSSTWPDGDLARLHGSARRFKLTALARQVEMWQHCRIRQ